MKRFTNGVRAAIAQKNWYLALSTALTLPDVCGKLEHPTAQSKERYVGWYEKWLQPKYTHRVGAERTEMVFLGGLDCYALRCSYLHEGGGNIENQRAREALDKFHFITPPPNGTSVHCNMVNTMLQLQVDIFCRDVVEAVDRWSSSVAANVDVQGRMESLLVIHDSSRGVRF